MSQHEHCITRTHPDIWPIVSFLQDTNNTRVTDRGVNLRLLKKAVEMLPDYAPADDETEELLDQIFAILFHIVWPLRTYVAEEWFDEHYIPTGKSEPNSTIAQRANEILSVLGIVKSQPRFKVLGKANG